MCIIADWIGILHLQDYKASFEADMIFRGTRQQQLQEKSQLKSLSNHRWVYISKIDRFR